MNIGEKIRDLRRKNGLTQEQLADRLHLSYQAVSKWENGASCPDLSLIAPLTKVLHVSADDLLGLNDTEIDTRYEELQKEYDLTFATEDTAKRQAICETAVKEYPGDGKWLSRLAWTVSNRSFEREDPQAVAAEQEKAIKLFDAVIKSGADERLRGDAINGITQLLCWRGRKNEARQYAEMLPEKTARTRDSVMDNVLDGEELLRFKQERLNTNFRGVLRDLALMPDREYTELIREFIKIMIPDGNYLLYHLDLYYNARRAVLHAIRTGEEKEKILPLLEEMKNHAKEYDIIAFEKPGVYRYTVPHLRLIEEDTRAWLGSQGQCATDGFNSFLQEKPFDYLREDKAFQKLLL